MIEARPQPRRSTSARRSSGSAPAWLPAAAWLLLGGAMWAGIALLAARMFATDPPTAGFDLALLIAAGRDVAAGSSPYDPAIVAGIAPAGPSLFYSYPPAVAQAMALAAGLPSGLVFGAWSIAAVAGVGAVAAVLRGPLAARADRHVVVAGSVAAASVVLPFAIAILFGNVDAFFPLLYGLLLAGCLASARRGQLLGGASLALAAIAKVHPASIGIWVVARLFRARRDGWPRPLVGVVAGGAGTAVAVLVVSLVVGGPAIWLEYARVATVIGGSDLLDPRNLAPAAQLGLFLGGDNGLVRLLHLPVALVAVGVTTWAALALEDTVESLAWATAASLFVLPITWYHYPAALVPFGIAAMLRAHGSPDAARVAALLAAAGALAAAGLVWTPLVWLAVGLVVAATRASRPRSRAIR